MSDPSPGERTEQGPDVDWAALKVAVDEMTAALALVRGSFTLIYRVSLTNLNYFYQPQFTGNFDSSSGDDTALLTDINSRVQGLHQAVSKDQTHTLSPEAIVRYAPYK